MAYEKHLKIAQEAARIAGVETLKVYESGDFQVEYKGHDDPVGIADKSSNITLCNILHAEYPHFGILTEEEIDPEDIKSDYNRFKDAIGGWREKEYCWLIDPLDGTKEFLKRSGEFGIHIGLTKNGEPVLGINYYPASDTMYSAVKSQGAYKQTASSTERIHVSAVDDLSSIRLVMSRSHPDKNLARFIESHSLGEPVRVGSAGLKLCKVAEGAADLFLVLRPKTYLWDTCSAEVIVKEAGGVITDSMGNLIDYRRKDGTNIKEGLIVSNVPYHKKIVGLVNSGHNL